MLKIDFYDVDPAMFDNLMAIIKEKNIGIHHPRGMKRKSPQKMSILPAAVPVASLKILSSPVISNELLNDDD